MNCETCGSEYRTVPSLIDAAAEEMSSGASASFRETCLQVYGNNWMKTAVCQCRYLVLMEQAEQLYEERFGG